MLSVPDEQGPGGSVHQEDAAFVQFHGVGRKGEGAAGYGLEGRGAPLQHLGGARAFGASQQQEPAILQEQGPVALAGLGHGRPGREPVGGGVEPFG